MNRLVSQRPYVSKKDSTEKGVTLRLLITQDDSDYGSDKKTGLKRDSNTLNNFDLTILNGKEHINVQKGEYVRLIDILHEKSFVIGFDVVLRFRDVEKINVQTK